MGGKSSVFFWVNFVVSFEKYRIFPSMSYWLSMRFQIISKFYNSLKIKWQIEIIDSNISFWILNVQNESFK